MNDIDMSAYTGTQYNIIGNETTPFTGSFNGNGHVIRNLTYKTTANVNCVGLIGRTYGAKLHNFGLENVSILSNGYYIGGLVGDLGGHWQENMVGMITACYVSGSVQGSDFVGGLAGTCEDSEVINCYTNASVSGTHFIGGLIGYSLWHSKLSFCYSAGLVNGPIFAGGMVGGISEKDMLTSCFWDIFTSEKENSIGNIDPDPEGVIGILTEEMQMQSTFTSAGWDFTNESTNGTSDFWRMCIDGVDYPHLNWESPKGDFSCPDGVNTEDLINYSGYWLINNCVLDNNYCNRTDLNYSGVVDLGDFAIFAENWMRQ